jgi:protein phosphatase
VITRALGTDPDVDVDTFSIEAKPGDLFLLCSDGLTSMVDDETILREAERNRSDLRAAAKALVRAANKGGGEDNITVVFFEIAGSGSDGVTERTVALPPVEDDEDATLSEVDRVPAIAVEEPDRRDAGHPGRNALLALIGLLVILAVLGGAVWGLWRSHFVGAEPDGHVAVYQGVPWNLVGNIKLYRAVYVSPLLTAQLSQAERKKLFDHHLRSDDGARAQVRRYEEQIGAG